MATSAPIGLTETAVQVVESATSTPAPLGMFGVLKRVASLPSRFIARVRLIDELLEQNAERQAAEIAAALNGTDMSHAPRLNYPSWFAGDRPMPGPWGFFTSWYVIGLALTSFLAHRIQHVVVPPRRRAWEHPIRAQRPPGITRFIESLLWRFVPVDLTTFRYRLIMRLPTMYLLLRSLVLWVTVLLQVSDLYPSWSLLQPFGEKVASLSMEDLCWSTFVATCATLLVGALNRGLEGVASSNTAPFNLVSNIFGYAFMLYVYGSPITHIDKPANKPSRPDTDILIVVIIPVLQVTLLHGLGISKRWSKRRLLPTGLCSLLTLAHFHYVLWFSSSSYPLLNFTPCLIETLLLAATLTTAGLSAFAQLLATGTIDNPVLGHSRALRPSLDDDFSIALLKIGTASLDATSVAGLGNEVSEVVAGSLAGRVHLNRSGVDTLKRAPEGMCGLGNELTRVSARGTYISLTSSSAWLREFAAYGRAWRRIARGAFRWVRAVTKGERPQFPVLREREAEGAHTPAEGVVDAGGVLTRFPSRPPYDEDELDDAYERFLAGDVDDDDDDADTDFDPRGASRAASRPPERGSPEVISDEEDDSSDVQDAAGLYADHAQEADVDAPVLLAHLTHAHPGALTRRRYRRLAVPRAASEPPGDDPSTWSHFLEERRSQARAKHEQTHDERTEAPACVICTVEPRQVILWPCRCLALCDDCRANLATRSSASSHSCPCCRQQVEGYSKIYIP